MNMTYAHRRETLANEYEKLIVRPNSPVLPGNGIYERYVLQRRYRARKRLSINLLRVFRYALPRDRLLNRAEQGLFGE